MGVYEDNPVCRRQPHEACRTTNVTLDQLVRVLAKANACFSHRLIKAHGGTAAAVAPEYDLSDSRGKSRLILPKKVNSRLYVEGRLLEYDLRFVVIEPGIHAQHHKTPVAHFTARGQVQEITRAMHGHDTNVRRSRGGPPECGLSLAKLMVGRKILGERSRASECDKTKKGDY